MTYEELIANYPIGKIIHREEKIYNRTGWWYNEGDKEFYRTKYPDVVFYPDNTCTYTQKSIYEKIVEGYIYDGEEWYPARDTWDGWEPYIIDE